MMTRVRDDITIVTNDRDRLLAQIDRNPGGKTSALETLAKSRSRRSAAAAKLASFAPQFPII
ncbi:hypothetical protein [Blastomonas fulva]|nr:hypothetical protein [Blastomonas fulva]